MEFKIRTRKENRYTVKNDINCSDGIEDSNDSDGNDIEIVAEEENREQEVGNQNEQEVRQERPLVTRSGRNVTVSKYLSDYEIYVAYCLLSATEEEPKTFQEAVKSHKWQQAIRSELKSHKNLQTWTPVELPEGKQAIDTRWVFKVEENGKKEARLVAKGFQANAKADEANESDANSIPGPPDGGYGWVVVFASFMCNMVVDGVSYCFGIFLDDLANYYGASQGKVAWVGSILAGITMCSGPFVSGVINRYGCRVTCLAGALVSAASFGLSVLCPSVEWLMIVYGVGGGLGFGLMYVPAVVNVGYYFEKRRSLATGIAVCGSGFGTFAFAPLGAYFLNSYGWKGANLVLAGICLSCVIFAILMKPIAYEKKSDEAAVVDAGLQLSSENVTKSLEDLSMSRRISIASNKSVKIHNLAPLARKDIFYGGSVTNLKEYKSQKTLHDYRQSVMVLNHPKYEDDKCMQFKQLLDLSLMKDSTFLATAAFNFLSFIGLYVPFVYIVDCAKEDGIDKESASLFISIIGFTNTLGRIVCGFIADLPQVNTLLLNNVCLIVMGLAVAAGPFCHTFTAYTCMSIAYGSAMAGYISLASILLVEYLGLESLTSSFGLLLLFRGTAAFIGSPLAGMLYDSTHSYTASFLVASVFFGAATVTAFCIPLIERRKNKSVVYDDEALRPMNSKKESS